VKEHEQIVTDFIECQIIRHKTEPPLRATKLLEYVRRVFDAIMDQSKMDKGTGNWVMKHIENLSDIEAEGLAYQIVV
jgi:hypothetical protein